jgi:Uma2 family endonuclease
MAVRTPPISAREFDEIVLLPENDDKILELIAAEIYEVPSNPKSSYYAMRILLRIGNFIEDKDLGFVTGEAGGYWVNGERYAPDVAYISKARTGDLAERGYNPVPPDLAVEVDFPSTPQSQEQLRFKIFNYVAAGTVVWVVFPETQTVEIYVPGQPPKRLSIDDTIDGGAVLQGFEMRVREVFGM